MIEKGGGVRGREGTGDSGGSPAAIFSPLGVPTSAREVVDSVSISSSLLNHEKFMKKRIFTLEMCCTVNLSNSSTQKTDLSEDRVWGGGGGEVPLDAVPKKSNQT